MVVEIFFDGAANNHTHVKTGKAPMGVGVYARADGVDFFKEGYFVGYGTSMDAEWAAFVLAMKVAVLATKKFAHERVLKIRMFNDNQVVVNQYNILHHNKENYQYYYDKVLGLYKQIGSNRIVTVKWIPRECNTVADALSKKGRIWGENELKGFSAPEIPFEKF